MLSHYVTIAFKVLLRRKFFTFISLFGISFTLMVLVVVTALLDHMLVPLAPESRQDRMLYAEHGVMWGPNNITQGSLGFKLFDRYARDLPGVEAIAIASAGGLVDSYVNGAKIQSHLKRTDGEYWQVFDFTFYEGSPYSPRDVDEARFVAVINRTTRARFFGDGPAVGQTIEAGGQRFRVVGVVQDISQVRPFVYSDIWVPHTTSRSSQYRDQLMSGFRAVVLAEDSALLSQIREEFNSRLQRVEFDDPRRYTNIVAPLETRFGMLARGMPFADPRALESQSWKLAAILGLAGLLFSLLPTIDLVNINISRIMERASEIGVRKAFGASSRTLVGQFIVENVLLTIVGGLLGLGLAAFVVRALNQLGVPQYLALTINLRVFAYGLLLAMAFGLLSGAYPAWRMSRLHPSEAIRGGAR